MAAARDMRRDGSEARSAPGRDRHCSREPQVIGSAQNQRSLGVANAAVDAATGPEIRPLEPDLVRTSVGKALAEALLAAPHTPPPTVGTWSVDHERSLEPSIRLPAAAQRRQSVEPCGRARRPGSFANPPEIGGPLAFSSPDTPGMPAPSRRTAWDFMPPGWIARRRRRLARARRLRAGHAARARAARHRDAARCERVAEREPHLTPEQVRDEVAAGRMVIPANKVHLARRPRPDGIGRASTTKINANMGASPVVGGTDEEVEKLHWAERWGADTVMDLSTGGDLDATREAIVKNARVPIGTVPDLLDDRRPPDRGARRSQHPRRPRAPGAQGVDYFTIHAGVLREHLPFVREPPDRDRDPRRLAAREVDAPPRPPEPDVRALGRDLRDPAPLRRHVLDRRRAAPGRARRRHRPRAARRARDARRAHRARLAARLPGDDRGAGPRAVRSDRVQHEAPAAAVPRRAVLRARARSSPTSSPATTTSRAASAPPRPPTTARRCSAT